MNLHTINPELAQLIAAMALNYQGVRNMLSEEVLQKLNIPGVVVPKEMVGWWDDWTRNVFSPKDYEGVDELLLSLMSDWLQEDMEVAFRGIKGLEEVF